MIRRPPRSTLDRSSAASDVYKRQLEEVAQDVVGDAPDEGDDFVVGGLIHGPQAVSYTHLRAHETVLDLVCRLLLEKKQNTSSDTPHCS